MALADRLARVSFLLGAGASREAGLPTSTGLTRAICDVVEKSYGDRNPLAQALNVAIAALTGHDVARGGNVFEGIDVERLFSAVQMLADRENAELTPFVSSWNRSLDGLSQHGLDSHHFQRRFKELLVNKMEDAGDTFTRYFAASVRSVFSSGADSVFAALESAMLIALRAALQVDAAKVDYLSPLFNATDRPVQIATLNYDRSVEILAERAGLSLSVGVEHWAGGFEWEWGEDHGIHLLKLHGSVDWWAVDRHPDEQTVGLQLRDEAIIVQSTPRDGESVRPALVFGLRGKLRAAGPFLAMLREFDAFLSQTDELVVVGYSFRDGHINASIRRWLSHNKDAALTIIDPAMDPNEMRYTSIDGVGLITGTSETFLADIGSYITQPISDGVITEFVSRPPHRVLRESASQGLEKVLGPHHL